MHTKEAQDKATEQAAKHARELAEVQKQADTVGEEKQMLQQQLASAERLRRTMIEADRVMHCQHAHMGVCLVHYHMLSLRMQSHAWCQGFHRSICCRN
jgi:hypothetical protein